MAKGQERRQRKGGGRQSWSPSPGEVVEVVIGTLGSAGRGVVRHKGRQMIVRGALPGDLAQVRITGLERGVVEGKTEKILESKIGRIPAQCPHFDVCGGCDWLDVAYEDQLALKQGFVAERLSAPGLNGPEPAEILRSEEPLYYRNRMDFSFGTGMEARLMLGLFTASDKLETAQGQSEKTGEETRVSVSRGSMPPVFDVTNCLLQSEQSNKILRSAREVYAGGRYRAYDPASRSGWLRSLAVRESKHTGDSVVDLMVARSGPGADLAEGLMQAVPAVKGVVETVNRKRSRHAEPSSRSVVAGEGQLTESVLNLEILVSPLSFTQANSKQTGRLYETALAFAELSGGEKVLDLYCGAGALSLPLARHSGRVTGIELEEQAVEDALENARLNGTGNCEFVCGDVTEALPAVYERGDRFDVVCVNPPRPGVDRAVIRQIVKGRPDRVVYVSCNPVSLARDLRVFVDGGYKIEQVQPVDMFPQTRHVEVVVKLGKG